MASRLGKDRSTVANTLRLLKLPGPVKEELLHDRITAGHARAILSLEDEGKQKELCRLILAKGLSVREAEALARTLSRPPKKSPLSDREKEAIASQLSALQDALKRCLGTKVRIVNKGKNGRIEIDYYSNEDLQRIIEAILGSELG